MGYVHNEYKLNGFTVEIANDDFAVNPDTWGNEEFFLGELNTRNYGLGRKGWGKSDAEKHIPFGEGPWDIENTDYYDLALRTDDPVELRAHWEDVHDKGWIVYAVKVRDYGSNGCRIEESDHDDCDGYVFVKLPYSSDLERLTMPDFDPDALKDSLLETWNAYASGDVHEAVIKDSDGEIVESCCGFYGEENAEEWAKDTVNGLMNQSRKVPMVVVRGTLPLPFPSSVEGDAIEVDVPLHIGTRDSIRWALEDGPFKDHCDVVSICLYEPRVNKEAAK